MKSDTNFCQVFKPYDYGENIKKNILNYKKNLNKSFSKKKKNFKKTFSNEIIKSDSHIQVSPNGRIKNHTSSNFNKKTSPSFTPHLKDQKRDTRFEINNIPSIKLLQNNDSVNTKKDLIKSILKENHKKNMELIVKKNHNINFRDPDKFINYIIRDHGIGETTDHVANSKYKTLNLEKSLKC